MTSSKNKPTKLVNDHAGPYWIRALPNNWSVSSVAYDDSTSTRDSHCIGQDPRWPATGETALLAIYRSWGIGNKKTSNGVLILCSDRRQADTHRSGVSAWKAPYPILLPTRSSVTILRPISDPAIIIKDWIRGHRDHSLQAATWKYKAPEGYCANAEPRWRIR